MNILFDASLLFHASKGGGIYNYLLRFLPLLCQKVKKDNDKLAFLNIYFREKCAPPDFLLECDVKKICFPIKLLNRAWIKYGIPDLSWFYKDVDVFHSPHFSLPAISGAKKILTVHDLTYLKHPEYFSESGRELNEYGYKTLLPVNIKLADKIIAISHHTKLDIMEQFGISENKIDVIYHGCDTPENYEMKKLNALLSRFGLEKTRYVYFPVGTFEPRKNMQKTIESFNKTNPEPGKLKLVISGVGDKTSMRIRASTDDVIIVRWDSFVEMNALYQGALFVVYPSLYEGFGMPVIEAMGNRKAVLTSNTTSLEEIANGFAHTVDPENSDEIVKGFELLFNNMEYRHQLELKSEKRAQDFSWDKMAEKTYYIYKSLTDVTA